MKNVKSTITRIKNKCDGLIPDGQDIFGFHGISKELILTSLDESYDFANAIENFEGKLETILLKRKISDISDKINKFNDRDFNLKGGKDDFDKFLRLIIEIRYSLKDTYISLANEPIRSEIEIAKAKEQLNDLNTNVIDLKTLYIEIKAIEKQSKELVENFRDTFNGAEQLLKDSQSEYKIVKESTPVIIENKAKSESYVERILEDFEEIDSYKINLESINSQSIEFAKFFEENKKNINEINGKIKKSQEDCIIQEERIKNTLDDAIKLGLAGSFLKRKEELKVTLRFWTVASFITILLLLAVTMYILLPIADGNHSKELIYIKVPIFFSAIWLAWFSTKQYGFTARLFEDYSFKYAISLAFEGYKDATKEVDETILKDLITLTISNISKNPIENYNTKSNHATPYNEFLERFWPKQNKKKKVKINNGDEKC